VTIVALSLWFPFPPDNGSRARAFYLLRELARRGHQIRLITGIQPDTNFNEGTPAELAEICRSVTAIPHQWVDTKNVGLFSALSSVPRAVKQSVNPALTAALTLSLRLPMDVLLVFERGADSYLPETDDFPPALLDQVEFSGDFDKTHRLTGMKSVRYWRQQLQRYQAVTAVSEAETAAARQALGMPESGAPTVHTAPNGADVAAFEKRPATGTIPGWLVFTGSQTYAPNREAVLHFAREIYPRLITRYSLSANPHLLVTGRLNGDESTFSCVSYSGFLPDMRPVWSSAEIAIVPLLRGGGTRIKILEAWASGVPVVSTSVGAAGLDALHGEHLLIADTPDDFARAIALLLNEPARAAALAENARRFVEMRYDWSVIGGKMDDLLQGIAAGGS